MLWCVPCEGRGRECCVCLVKEKVMLLFPHEGKIYNVYVINGSYRGSERCFRVPSSTTLCCAHSDLLACIYVQQADVPIE